MTVQRRILALETERGAKAKDPMLMTLPELYAALVREVTGGRPERLDEVLAGSEGAEWGMTVQQVRAWVRRVHVVR